MAKDNSIDRNDDKKLKPKTLIEQVTYIPDVIIELLKRCTKDKQINIDIFGEKVDLIFRKVHRIQIITTEENYNVGLMARYWLEEISGIPCQIEIAAHYINRVKVVESNKLCVILTNSGEEAQSLNALHTAKDVGYVAILGVSHAYSTIIRESDLSLLTNSLDNQIYSAPTQIFTAQLTGLFLLSIALGRYHRLNKHSENSLIRKIEFLPNVINDIFLLGHKIEDFSTILSDNEQAVFLGRDIQYPIALEGAAKLKEYAEMSTIARSPEEFLVNPFKDLRSISYHLPVIALAPSYDIFDQWKANFLNFNKLEYEVFVISDKRFADNESMNMKILPMPAVDRLFSPMVYTIPILLLAYHTGMNREVIT